MRFHYEFTSGGVYMSPSELSLDEVKYLVQKLPSEDDPELFGLHPNALITL